MLKSIIKILSYSLILLTIVGFQCEKIEPNKRVKLEMSDNFYVFTIKEGAHNSFTGLETFASNHLSFIVKFDSTAIYTNELPENQADINKLYGFTDCNTGVHSNSARFGWRYFEDNLELFSYCYNDGERTTKLLESIDIGEEYHLEIIIMQNTYVFKINNVIKTKEARYCNENNGKNNYLYPYFGGDELAPHDINVYIKDLK